MPEFRFRELERYRTGGTRDRMELSVPLPKSPSGKIYRYSPNPVAVPRLFQLGDAPQERSVADEHLVRIRRQPGPGETICPYSGYQAPDQEFIHVDDLEAIQKQIAWAVEADAQDWFDALARDFNRRQPRGGLISMRMETKSHRRHQPLAIREDLLRDLTCNVCCRQYGVYAIGLFCPDCGAPNVGLHFNRELELVRQQIALANEKDVAGRSELAYRLMGNAHEDVLTAFETNLKTIYRHLIRERLPDQAQELCAPRAIRNIFQNVARTREKFADINLDPFAVLDTEKLRFFALNIQKRHIIGHNLGVADELYTELAQEQQPGHTVRLLGEEIARFGEICANVVHHLETTLLPAE